MCDCDCELPKRAKWEQIKREHAHELAEKIREAGGPAVPHLLVGGFWWDSRDRDHAADLIDPEVSDG